MWEQIGKAETEIGMLVIGMPSEELAEKAMAGYEEAMLANDPEKWVMGGGYAVLDNGYSLVITTGGDGGFPVYIRRNGDGRIAEVRVMIDPQQPAAGGQGE